MPFLKARRRREFFLDLLPPHLGDPGGAVILLPPHLATPGGAVKKNCPPTQWGGSWIPDLNQ